MNPPKPIWIDPVRRKAAEEAEAEAEAAKVKRSYSVAVSQPLALIQTIPEDDDEDAKTIASIVNSKPESPSLSQSH